jgi:hypothetical protein
MLYTQRAVRDVRRTRFIGRQLLREVQGLLRRVRPSQKVHQGRVHQGAELSLLLIQGLDPAQWLPGLEVAASLGLDQAFWRLFRIK